MKALAQPRTYLAAGIILFWTVMMGIHIKTEFFPLYHSGSITSSPTSNEIINYLTREKQIHYVIRRGKHGTQIGESYRRVRQKTPSPVIENTLTLDLSSFYNTKSSNQSGYDGTQTNSFTMQKIATYSQQGNLNKFQTSFKLNGDFFLKNVLAPFLELDELKITGKRKGEKLQISYGSSGISRLLPAPESIEISNSFHPMGTVYPPAPGTKRTIQIMNPIDRSTNKYTIRTRRKRNTILWRGNKTEAYQVRLQGPDENDIQVISWVTKNNVLLRQELDHPLFPETFFFERMTPLPEE